MDPGVRSHGMKADPPGYLWSKYECFLMSGWWDILHSSCLHGKLWSNSTYGTEVQMNEHTNGRTERRKLYIPWHKCQGYKNEQHLQSRIRHTNISWITVFHNFPFISLHRKQSTITSLILFCFLQNNRQSKPSCKKVKDQLNKIHASSIQTFEKGFRWLIV